MANDFHNIDSTKLPLSLVDDLTQLCNRRFIYNNMPKIITQDEDYAKKTSLFMVDIDDFKKINDTFGHLVGDMILMELAGVMKKSVAENGIVARYAGDEFLILLPGLEEDQAHKIGETILQNSSELNLLIKDKNFKGQALSIGIAVYPNDSTTMKELIDCADQALYAAKKSGKNKIFHYKSVSKEMKNRTIVKQMLLRPPLVNRKKELDIIKEHYKISEGAKKQGILVEGESGIGKTRLIEEFGGWTKTQNSLFLFCKLGQKEESGPFTAFVELLRLVANSLGADEFGGVLAKLIPSELAEILYLYPAAKSFIKTTPVKDESERKAENLFSGLCKILINATDKKTLVLAVDNLHYANEITLQFFSLLLRISSATKFLFIGSCDKENEGILKDLFAKDIFTTIKLVPLVKDEVGRLIVSIFPNITLKPKQIENIFKTSRGNPLLLGEILKNLVEKGYIEHEGDGWKLKDIGIEDIPDSLSDAVEPTIENLDDKTKELLSMMAVMGGKIKLDTLENFSGYKEGHLIELLDRAIKAGVIKAPDSDYDSLYFRTESARKILADKVPAQEAQSIHHKFAELIKQDFKDGLPAQLDRLIHHLDLAKEKELALKYKNISQKLNEEYSLSTDLTNILEKIERQKEAPASIEELLERPLSEASVKIIKNVILTLRAAIIGTLLYPSGNSMRIDLENRSYEAILKILKNDPILTISSIESKILVNGHAPKHIDINTAVGFTLLSLMEDHGVNSISFKYDLRKEELAYFLHYLANIEEENVQEEGLAEILKRKGVSHIKIDQVKYEKLSKIQKAIGNKGAYGKMSSMVELSKNSLLDMPVEKYFDPRMAGNLGLIAEALILNKNNEKVKNIVDKFSENLNTATIEDKFAVAEGAIKLSESLLIYEKKDLLDTLIKALLNRFNSAKQSKEFTGLCSGLQSMAVRLIDKGNFNLAGTIINQFKGQLTADSNRIPEQKKLVEDELQKIAHPKMVEALMGAFKEKLKSSNPADIAGILEALGEYALDSMLKILTQEESCEKDPFELFVIRHSVAMILKKIGQSANDALKKILTTDKRSFVKKNVMEVLGYIGSKEFAPELASFLHDDSLEVRMQCVVTLKKIGTVESLKILTEALKDSNEDMKEAASLTIAELADQSFIEELKPLLADKSTENIARSTIQKIQTKKKK